MQLTDDSTIGEAKTVLRENWEKGVECPCCTQLVKLYSRKLYSVMAVMLIKLYKYDKQHPSEYVHVSELMWKGQTANYDFSKLRYWGLIAEKTKDADANKRTSGYWAITDKGRDFVEGRRSISKYVQLFDSKKFGYTGEQVTIKDALGDDFDYRELMGDLASREPEQGSLL